MTIGRAQILEQLSERSKAADWLLAAWEGGSAAFERHDEFSDIDWVLVAPPGLVEEAIALVEEALRELSPIAARYRLPEPTWHGHAQVFYRLTDASPDHFIDLVVMRPDAKDFLLQPELHGQARFHFDRIGLAPPPRLDPAAVIGGNEARVESIRARHGVYGVLASKELRRGRPIDALAFYQSVTLRHLVELLRIRHDPCRPTFGLRYLEQDLPPDVRARLEPLLFVGSPAELAERLGAADAWIDELLGE